MKIKSILLLTAMLFLHSHSKSYADYVILRDASSQTRGILPNERLSASSVTLQGNTFNGPNQLVQLNSSGEFNVSNLPDEVRQRIGNLDVSTEVITALINTVISSQTAKNIEFKDSTTTLSTTKISSGAGTVDNFHLAANSVTSSKILDGTIVAADVASSIFISSGSQAVDSFHLKNTAVTPGSYTNSNLTIGADGRVTSASNGSGGSTTATSSVINNLVITTVAANTNQFIVTADAIDIQGCYFTSISTTVDLSKANSLGGSNLADPAYTFHSLWLTASSDCSQYGIIADTGSASISSVNLRGHTKARWITSAIYNDSSSNIIPFIKSSGLVRFFTHQTVLTAATFTTTYQSADISNLVSKNASFVNYVFQSGSLSDQNYIVHFAPVNQIDGGAANGLGDTFAFGYYVSGVTVANYFAGRFSLGIIGTDISSKKFLFKRNGGGGTLTGSVSIDSYLEN